MRSLLLLCLLTACAHRPAITARSEYFDAKYLASSQVDTPDPCRSCFSGQQIVINWHVLTRCLPAQIHLSVRYGDHTTDEATYDVTAPSGFWFFRLLNKEFWDKQGILSYSVRLYGCDGHLISKWNHHLWAELITITCN